MIIWQVARKDLAQFLLDPSLSLSPLCNPFHEVPLKIINPDGTISNYSRRADGPGYKVDYALVRSIDWVMLTRRNPHADAWTGLALIRLTEQLGGVISFCDN